MSVARRFGANFARTRRRAGLSQEEVAIRASLHRTEIGLVERGERLPRIDTALRLAGALEIPLGDLLDGITWKPGQTVVGKFVETEVPGLGTVQRRFDVERKS